MSTAPKNKTTAATAAKKDRTLPELTSIRTDIALPVGATSARGSKSLYPFDTLTVNGSFGVKNKTAKQLSTIVSNQNRKASNNVAKKDAEGNVIYKTKRVTGADNTEIEVPTNEPETVRVKEFRAYDVNPKEDPDGASVRVFRIA